MGLFKNRNEEPEERRLRIEKKIAELHVDRKRLELEIAMIDREIRELQSKVQGGFQ